MTPYVHIKNHNDLYIAESSRSNRKWIGKSLPGAGPDLVTVKTILVSGLPVVKGQVFKPTCYGRSCELKT